MSDKRVWKYYWNWRNEPFTCKHCGWTGTVSDKDLEAGDVAAIIECPKCYRSLGVVGFPNLKETEEAAAQGTQEAIAALLGFRRRIKDNEDLLERFAREKIERADQLPELDGDSLEFVWDFVKETGGEYYQIIRLGEKELWKELAFFNNLRRFEEVKHLLREKYGSRFKTLTPTDASIEWLSGDDLGKALALTYT